MQSITINFHGDFKLIVTPEQAKRVMNAFQNDTDKPVSKEDLEGLLNSMGNFLGDTSEEYSAIGSGVDEMDIDPIVMVLRPGETPAIMMDSECYERVEQHGNFSEALAIHAPDICAYGLLAAYDPRTVLKLGEEKYILGPVIVYACDEDGDSTSLDAEEVMAAIVFFHDHTVTLCADGEDVPAFYLERGSYERI